MDESMWIVSSSSMAVAIVNLLELMFNMSSLCASLDCQDYSSRKLHAAISCGDFAISF